MVTNPSSHFFRTSLCLNPGTRQITTLNQKPTWISHSPSKLSGKPKLTKAETEPKVKWAVRLSSAEPSLQPNSTVEGNSLLDFVKEDFLHIFDDQELAQMVYDECIRYRDPVTKHDNLDGFLFNLALLKTLFRSEFQLHDMKQVLTDLISHFCTRRRQILVFFKFTLTRH
uniref:Uncharacterized protein n=1 Tax=Nelumbo nucifera TaxID=4432 RepID=A0A822ZMW9_NELNU|nr:TPA_asm: hypothetical protein HUJ06_003055 [Nelumbo nucifera]